MVSGQLGVDPATGKCRELRRATVPRQRRGPADRCRRHLCRCRQDHGLPGRHCRLRCRERDLPPGSRPRSPRAAPSDRLLAGRLISFEIGRRRSLRRWRRIAKHDMQKDPAVRAAGSLIKRCDKNDPFPPLPRNQRVSLPCGLFAGSGRRWAPDTFSAVATGHGSWAWPLPVGEQR